MMKQGTRLDAKDDTAKLGKALVLLCTWGREATSKARELEQAQPEPATHALWIRWGSRQKLAI